MLSAANDDDATNGTGTVTIPSSGDGPIPTITGAVAITPTSGSRSKTTVRDALTFTDGNRDGPQTVTVRGLAQGAPASTMP